MVNLDEFISGFSSILGTPENSQPWEITANISVILNNLISKLDETFIVQGDVAVHKSAVIETGVVLKGPIIIGENCFIGANAYLRGGVYLGKDSKIGTGCEIKSSIILNKSNIAHFNFIGDSIIGNNVNFEAGSITANHYNERDNKRIFVVYNSKITDTKVEKFGALAGDHSKIGANAVLSPGTLLGRDSVVKRLELIDQINLFNNQIYKQ